MSEADLTRAQMLLFGLRRIPECDSKTCLAYYNKKYLVGFDRSDGHLAFLIERATKEFVYACEHVKLGAEMLEPVGH